MLSPKDYQLRALKALRDYFLECKRIGNADTAYYETTRRVFGMGISYRPVKELPGLPYVCLRIPTGGGKTLVACHSVGIAARYFLQADRSVALWLVPSNAIKEQTLNALKDKNHPYRASLDSTVGSVKVLDVTEALSVQRADMDSRTTIIVSTMQAFRVNDTEGRKVYENDGALISHFTGLPTETLEALDKYPDGTPIHSLANVLRYRRPIIIVDEAHNARTDLSFETLARFNPSCIIEFTATPDREHNPSNIIHSVSAAELYAEDMIKLPIRLETRPQWKELLGDAVATRNQLESLAVAERKQTGEYIRPIMLVQAQPRREGRETLTVEVVERTLMDDYNIPREQIARATGTDRELDGTDILAPDCKIRFVITVQALREGWDCPFAYVLCSVAEMSSSTAIEQILGRIMRLPKAKRKERKELNLAYAFAASQNFFEAANALTDALVQNGFNRQEARELITQASPPETDSLFSNPEEFMGTVTLAVPERPQIDHLPTEIRDKISYDAGAGMMTFSGAMSDNERNALKDAFITPEGKAAVERVYRRTLGLSVEDTESASERGEAFSIPALAIKQGELFEVFEETHFLDTPWDLAKCDASLSEAEFPSSRPEGQQGEITLSDKGRVEARFISELHQQTTFLNASHGQTLPQLVYWLDRSIPHPDITPSESGAFLTKIVRELVDGRGFTLDQLARDKYRLRDAVATKIKRYRESAYVSGYQSFLLPDSPTPLIVTPDVCFSFDPLRYPYNFPYRGPYKFNKHYYPQVGDLRSEGEEFECAQFIDSLPEVKFWVRNLERRPSHSFWLQTSTDKFYPDFVCLLNDGRYFVVEYKGEDRWSNDDSKEKRDLGGLWEERSSGTCLFIMPKGKQFDTIRTKISQT